MISEILSAPLGKLCWKLSLPAIAGLLLIGGATFADAAFVGHLAGAEDLAAILVAFPITLINSAVAGWLGAGAAAVLSRALGGSEPDAGRRIGSIFMGWTLLVSAIVAALVIAWAPSIMGWLGASGAVRDVGASYTRIVFFGAPCVNFVFGASFLIRGEGKIAASMKLLGAGSVANIVLDGVFVGVLEMGAVGAGWATLITQIGTAVATLGWLLLSDSTLQARRWRPRLGALADRVIAGEMMRDGLGPLCMYLLSAVHQVLIFRETAVWGSDDDVVFVGAYLRVVMLALVPLWGMAMALQPVVGMAYGAKDHERIFGAFRVFALNATLIAVALTAIAWLFPAATLGLFIDDPQLIAPRVGAFRWLMLPLPAMGVVVMAATMFASLGHIWKVAVILFSRHLIIVWPLLLLMPYLFGLRGIWYALIVTDLCALLLALIATPRRRP